MRPAEKTLFMQTVGKFVVDRIRAALAPLVDRMDLLEARDIELTPAQLTQVEKIINARVEAAHFDWAQQCAVIEQRLANIPAGPPGPPGRDGVNGTNGTNGESVAADDLQRMVDIATARAVAALPVKPHVVSGYVDRTGNLYFNNSDGSFFKVGHVVGADADPAKIAETIKAEIAKIPLPKDGKDGLGFEDLQVEFDGERTLTLVFFRGGQAREFPVKLPICIYREVWTDGREYERGDNVTYDGSQWTALKATTARPGTSDDWRLSVRKGRDGKQGPAGKDGKPGARSDVTEFPNSDMKNGR